MIEWLEWDETAFARARRERKPVLLSIAAPWCGACHEMDRTTYADGGVAAAVRDRFVAVRVDADRRPDINERYNLGGWPTTAFLTPDGDLMTGGTFVSAERMVGILDRVAASFTAGDAQNRPSPSVLSPSAPSPQPPGPSSEPPTPQPPLPSPDLIDVTFETFDEVHGGFGIEPKFPHTAALHLAIALYETTGDARWRQRVERTLDGMADGGLWDARAGGFCRYSTRRDWQLPHPEKLLETNGSLLRLYADAGRAFGREIDRVRTAAIARFITTALAGERGGFHGSDADTVLLTDANASAARGLLAAASLLGDDELAQAAITSFERVVLACYTPGSGMAHYFDGKARVRGLLGDQIETIAALLDAHDAGGAEPHQMMAEELGHFVTRDLWDAADGGCVDRVIAAADVGLLRAARKPFVANADAAAAFARLARLSHEFDFAPFARGALTAAGQALAGQGPLTAHYLLAAAQVG